MRRKRFPKEYLGAYDLISGRWVLFSLVGPIKHAPLYILGRIEQKSVLGEPYRNFYIKKEDIKPVNKASKEFLETLCYDY